VVRTRVYLRDIDDWQAVSAAHGRCFGDIRPANTLLQVAALVGEGIGKADADFVRAHTGFVIGGVAPVGHGLTRTFVERSLAAYRELWAAAGHPHTVFRLTYGELLRITAGAEADLA